MRSWFLPALFVLALCTPSSAADLCQDEVEQQARKLGLPDPLAKALSGSLAIGHNGKMHPYAVKYGQKTFEGNSQKAAANYAHRLVSSGAANVQIGCLGVTIPIGSSLNTISSMIDPPYNVSRALRGINSVMSSGEIGKPLEEISKAQGTVGSTAPSVMEKSVPPPSPGISKKKKNKGDVGSTWGLFNNTVPGPLSNP